MNSDTFEYAGHIFCPYAKFKADRRSLEQFFNYQNKEFDNIKYNRNDFYSHSPAKNFDVFHCVDDGLLYVPTNLGLIEFYEPPIAEFCKARMVQDYEIIHSFLVGEREVIVGEDKNAEYRYFCGYYEANEFFSRAVDCQLCNDYLTIMQLYCDRIKEQVEQCRSKEIEGAGVITADMCKAVSGDMNLNRKVVVINPDTLRREYQNERHQLMYVTSGNGAMPNSRGTKVYGYILGNSNKKEIHIRRSEIMGIMENANLPEWASKALSKLQRDIQKEGR